MPSSVCQLSVVNYSSDWKRLLTYCFHSLRCKLIGKIARGAELAIGNSKRGAMQSVELDWLHFRRKVNEDLSYMWVLAMGGQCPLDIVVEFCVIFLPCFLAEGGHGYHVLWLLQKVFCLNFDRSLVEGRSMMVGSRMIVMEIWTSDLIGQLHTY